MLARIKTVVAFLLCAFVCGYAAYQQLQWLAIAALVGALSSLYKQKVEQSFTVALDFLRNTTQAKLGALELKTEKRLADLANRIDRQAAWVQMLVSQLSSEEIGLLLSISSDSRFIVNPAIRKHLRVLRDRGLIQHDQETMEASHHVWLTPLGADLVHVVFSASPSSPTVAALQNDEQAP